MLNVNHAKADIEVHQPKSTPRKQSVYSIPLNNKKQCTQYHSTNQQCTSLNKSTMYSILDSQPVQALLPLVNRPSGKDEEEGENKLRKERNNKH